jgi:hypothetical protein
MAAATAGEIVEPPNRDWAEAALITLGTPSDSYVVTDMAKL